MEIQDLSPAAFSDLLTRQGVQRFYLVWDPEGERVVASHPLLAPLARLLSGDRRDFDRHEGVFVQVSPETGVLQGAFVHRTISAIASLMATSPSSSAAPAPR